MTQISKLVLTNFRNILSKKLEFSRPLILLTGNNGIGKTNILESLTLLGKNSYLRGSDFEEMLNEDPISKEKQLQFAIYAQISNNDLIDNIGTSFDIYKKKKIFQINKEVLTSKKQSDLRGELLNFICLTPQIESLFILGKSDRRDFMDKIVSDINFDHNKRINSYQKSLRERLFILQKYRHQPAENKSQQQWLDIIENKIVELGMAIASSRIEAIEFFNNAMNSFTSNFPKAKLQVIGDVEQGVMKQSSLSLEQLYKKRLEENRSVDLDNFKTNFGVHRSDFDAIFSEKNMLATKSSTGEQKSIMLSITLARAKISSTYKNRPTILIFDEIVSHLDERRKMDLFEEISETKLQTFFSATSKNLIPEKYLNNDLLQVVEL